MASPFPGMDPYLEAQGVFPDLHTSIMTQLKSAWLPVLRPRYSVRTERRI